MVMFPLPWIWYNSHLHWLELDCALGMGWSCFPLPWIWYSSHLHRLGLDGSLGTHLTSCVVGFINEFIVASIKALKCN